jgi:hypothetical protein
MPKNRHVLDGEHGHKYWLSRPHARNVNGPGSKYQLFRHWGCDWYLSFPNTQGEKTLIHHHECGAREEADLVVAPNNAAKSCVTLRTNKSSPSKQKFVKSIC